MVTWLFDTVQVKSPDCRAKADEHKNRQPITDNNKNNFLKYIYPSPELLLINLFMPHLIPAFPHARGKEVRASSRSPLQILMPPQRQYWSDQQKKGLSLRKGQARHDQKTSKPAVPLSQPWTGNFALYPWGIDCSFRFALWMEYCLHFYLLQQN